jgi:hypothetical protein
MRVKCRQIVNSAQVATPRLLPHLIIPRRRVVASFVSSQRRVTAPCSEPPPARRRRLDLTAVMPLPEPANNDERDREEVQQPADNDERKGRAVLRVEAVVAESVVGYAPADHDEEERNRREEGGDELGRQRTSPN